MDGAVIVTGATRGLGQAIAAQLAGRAPLILAVRNEVAGHAQAARLPGRVEVRRLDTESPSEIEAFAAALDCPVAALINNAGAQFHGPVQHNRVGEERTLAVNHLGPLRLIEALGKRLAGGTVLNIGSGTHDPHDRGARLFGFRGGRFTSVAALAQGALPGTSERQATLDRYATSKLALMAATVELARRRPAVRFLTLDPGLMPGTGLVRTAPWPVRLGWHSVLRWVVPVMPGASTPARSAAAAIALTTETRFASGGIFDTSLRRAKVWERVIDPAFGAMVLDQSLDWIGQV